MVNEGPETAQQRVTEINNNRCVNVLPNINAYMAAAGQPMSSAVVPTGCLEVAATVSLTTSTLTLQLQANILSSPRTQAQSFHQVHQNQMPVVALRAPSHQPHHLPQLVALKVAPQLQPLLLQTAATETVLPLLLVVQPNLQLLVLRARLVRKQLQKLLPQRRQLQLVPAILSTRLKRERRSFED